VLQIVALAELAVCWIVWSLAFVKPSRQAAGQKKVVRDPASRWGILLVMLSFAFMGTYVRPAGFEKSTLSLVASMILGPLAVVLAWSATRQLGKQWRYEAALSEDHELIRSGPYRWVRHPIYASLLGMLLAVGTAWTWWPMLVASVIFYLIGTEIRVRAEDRLLASRFGEEFVVYKRTTPAYLPFVR
jgi:protein-S-isoprenylcysteine O-methyltransferase Ste14